MGISTEQTDRCSMFPHIIEQHVDRATATWTDGQKCSIFRQTDRAVTACPELHRQSKLKHRSLGAIQLDALFKFLKMS